MAAALYSSHEHPLPAFVVSDQGLLESALALPHQPYYESFADKLAAMVRSIAANHALEDGNKRLAMVVLHSTILVNGMVYVWTDEAAEALVTRCAKGEDDFRWLSEFIEMWGDDSADPEARIDPESLHETMEAMRDSRRDRIQMNQEIQSLFALFERHARGELQPAEIARLKAAFAEDRL